MNNKDDFDKLSDPMAGRIAEELRPVPAGEARTQSLGARLRQRAARSVAAHAGLHTVRRDDGTWSELRHGVRVKALHDNGRSRSVLVEFAPGTSLPSHRHQSHEECLVLRGCIETDDIRIGPMDYHLAPAGSRHSTIRSATGATIFLRGTSLGKGGSMLREMLSAWIPGPSDVATQTILADGQGWQPLADGVAMRPLWQADGRESLLIRMQPGTALPGHDHPAEEECMLISGELFLGDILLRAGEYQLGRPGSKHGEITTDVGALYYVNVPANWRSAGSSA